VRYGVLAACCGLLGLVGYALEVEYFGDNETISSLWRILATSGVVVLLVGALSAALVGWRRSAR
jgi:hypothetical protein